MRPPRTWLVSVLHAGASRTEEVDELAASIDGGLLVYADKAGLPPYLGIWLMSNGGEYHLYSDYPPEHHERFGDKQVS